MNRRSLVILILSLVGAAGCKSSGVKPPEDPPPGGAVKAEPFPPGFD